MISIYPLALGYICGLLTPLIIYKALEYRAGYMIKQKFVDKIADAVVISHRSDDKLAQQLFNFPKDSNIN